MAHLIVYARRTNELRYDDTLSAVDDEGTGIGHQREVAHKDVRFLDLTGLLIQQTRGNTQCRGICRVSLLTFDDRIVRMIHIERIINEVEHKVVLVVVDTRYILEDLLESFLEEPLIGFFLDLDQVRHIDDVFNFTEALTLCFAQFDIFDIDQKHITPSFDSSRKTRFGSQSNLMVSRLRSINHAIPHLLMQELPLPKGALVTRLYPNCLLTNGSDFAIILCRKFRLPQQA